MECNVENYKETLIRIGRINCSDSPGGQQQLSWTHKLAIDMTTVEHSGSISHDEVCDPRQRYVHVSFSL